MQDLSVWSPRTPEDQAYTCNISDIDHISSHLGILWQVEKDIPFSHEFPFTGFIWNLETKRVSIPASKKEKYLVAIARWQGSHSHTLLDV